MNLELQRPLIFFDLETTGVSRESKIVQIALIKIFPSGEIIEKCRLINPNMPIPPDATNIHGIRNDDVKDKPIFQHISKSLFELFDNCDVGGFNSRNYDLPILRNEFKNANIEYNYLDYLDIDVFLFEKHVRKKFNIARSENESLSLSSLYKLYTNKNLDGAHDALNDVKATIAVFNSQLEKYYKLTPQTVYNEIPNKGDYKTDHNPRIIKNGETYYWNFGKYDGKPIKIDVNYGKWFVSVDNFPLNERKIVSETLNLI